MEEKPYQVIKRSVIPAKLNSTNYSVSTTISNEAVDNTAVKTADNNSDSCEALLKNSNQLQLSYQSVEFSSNEEKMLAVNKYLIDNVAVNLYPPVTSIPANKSSLFLKRLFFVDGYDDSVSIY